MRDSELKCNECAPEASERINDCGPGRVYYYEPSVQLVRAATTIFSAMDHCQRSKTPLVEEVGCAPRPYMGEGGLAFP